MRARRKKMNTQVEILVNGKPIKQYNHNGNVYIEGREGSEYTIRIKNDSYSRKMAVVTVDGINVIDGKPQGNEIGIGYIVSGRSSIVVKGYRESDSHVGTFKFCKKGESYSQNVGIEGNNGVIGVRIYNEYVNPAPIITYRNNFDWQQCSRPIGSILNEPQYTCSANPLRSAHVHRFLDSTQSNGVTKSASNPDFNIGSTWGTKAEDKVTKIQFSVDDSTYFDHIIYYSDKKGLRKAGINIKPEKQVAIPKAFGVYATPPKGWKG